MKISIGWLQHSPLRTVKERVFSTVQNKAKLSKAMHVMFRLRHLATNKAGQSVYIVIYYKILHRYIHYLSLRSTK